MKTLKGKRILIFGLSSSRSIAFGVAKICSKEGAKIVATCLNEKLKNKIEKSSQIFESVEICDVNKTSCVKRLFKKMRMNNLFLDGIVHSIAFASKKSFQVDFLESINKKNFVSSSIISAYSFLEISKHCLESMNSNSSIVTISYIGSQRYVPYYNIMGPIKAFLETSVIYLAKSLGLGKNIRVNCIRSGPLNTISARSIKNFKGILENYKSKCIFNRNLRQEEIGHVAAFLLSEISTGINAEVINVDCGFSKIHL